MSEKENIKKEEVGKKTEEITAKPMAPAKLRRPLLIHVPLSEKIIFAKHMSMMVKAGMSELESLRLLKRQFKSRSLSYILQTLISDIENGQFLSVGLSQFKRVFGELFINIIRIGETSGNLAANLDYLSLELKKQQLLRQKIRSAIIYPIVILFATFGVVGVLVFFVMPKILPIFTSLRIKLPITTVILVNVTNFLFAYGHWVALGIVVFFIAFSFFLRITVFRFAYHRVLFFLPVVRGMVKAANMANFTRTLGILLKSGVTIVEALEITADTLPNLVYRKELKIAAQSVKRGEAMYKYLNEREQFFPPTISRMIEVGEATGNLDGNLLYLAEFYEGEVDEMAKNLSNVLEPLLLVVMGLIVGFVAISIITPIYEVTQGLQTK